MRVEKDIVVSAPVARVYELWTDFENFPRFMQHVEEVRRTGDSTLHWKAKLGPMTIEWDASIKALVPNRTVTWHSTSGAENAGAITLAEKGHITEMHVVIEYSPNLFERLAETVTHEMSRSVEQDLERFRALAEGRDVDAGTETSRSTTMSTSGSSMDTPDSEPSTDETAGTSSTSATPASNVEIEGLGSDESPGEAVGSTSPEEIAVARAALGGTPTTDDDSTSNATASSPMSGRSSVPSTGEMGLGANGGDPSEARNQAGTDFLNDAAADEQATESSMAGAPGNPGDQAGGISGVSPTRGDVDASSSTTPATDLTAPAGGSLGPSLMTYESGTTNPDRLLDNLGSVANDRTALGSTTVSTGSLTDTGRAGDTGGMAGGEAGFTTASTSSLAGSGDLGGGPDTVGGRATTPDLGHTPAGGGTGRGAGDAYGSSTTQSGGPHSSGMPFDATASGESTMGGDIATGGMSSSGSTDRGDMSIATGNAARDLDANDDTGATDRGDMSIATGNAARDLDPSDRGDMSIATGNAARDLDLSDDSGASDRGDMSIATGNAARDLEADDEAPVPAQDSATTGGTGANYTGGTGGWGTEAPDSSGTTGWSPSDADADTNRPSGGETH